MYSRRRGRRREGVRTGRLLKTRTTNETVAAENFLFPRIICLLILWAAPLELVSSMVQLRSFFVSDIPI